VTKGRQRRGAEGRGEGGSELQDSGAYCAAGCVSGIIQSPRKRCRRRERNCKDESNCPVETGVRFGNVSLFGQERRDKKWKATGRGKVHRSRNALEERRHYEWFWSPGADLVHICLAPNARNEEGLGGERKGSQERFISKKIALSLTIWGLIQKMK